MSATILRTVPCSKCGRRIGTGPEDCPYCGHRPKMWRAARSPASSPRARPCPMCGERMRAGGLVVRLLALVARRHRRMRCTACSYRDPMR